MKLQEVLKTKWGITIELVLFFLIALSTLQLGVVIPLLVIIYIISVKIRQLKWVNIGFDTSDINVKHILLGIFIAVFYQLVFHYILDPAFNSFLPPANINAIGNIKGDLSQLLTWLLISWTIGAVFEELIFRGYLLNRLIDLFGKSLQSKMIAVILSSIAFGFIHSYQGMNGIISTGIVGVFQAILFFLTKKKLVIPMVVHGTFDTISFIILYLGIS